MAGRSIASIAESILNDSLDDPNAVAEAVTKVQEDIPIETRSLVRDSIPIDQDGMAPDIKGVKVPQDFVDLVVEGKKNSLPPCKVCGNQTRDQKCGVCDKHVDEKKASVNSKGRLEELIQQLSSLLKEARSVLNEMTTAGMIGVNTAGPVKEKPKKKRKDINEIVKDVLETYGDKYNPWKVEK
jgi:hypothetical protein